MPKETLDETAAALVAMLPASPDAYPQKIDLVRQTVLLIRVDASLYRAASFLDDRMLGPATRGAWVSIAALADGASSVRKSQPVHFIFHIGHVGSTLVSRLLDETGEALSLREPLPLRSLAEAHDALGRADSLLSESQFDLVLASFLRLWGRGYDTTRCSVVKATSSAGRLAAAILCASEASRAIYMNLRAEPYLATLLAGENSTIDLRGHGPERIRRLQSRMIAPLPPLHALTAGELAAMSWLVESWTQREVLDRFPGKVIGLDFDRFLSARAEGIGKILEQFGLPQDWRYLSELDRSPAFSRYSKAPEYPYSPAMRSDALQASRSDNREEIRRGLEWLARVARSDKAAAAVVETADADRRC
jgi:hypothetical protein